MNRFYPKKAIAQKLPLALLLFFVTALSAWAQKPTGLSYPTPVVYNANISSVFLSPNVSGNVISYSMPASPALPSGLSFNTNTGVIQGVPTAALAQTSYTITATNPQGSTTASIVMTVTTNYVAVGDGNGVVFVNTPYNASSPNAPSVEYKVGDGKSAGNLTLYHNVFTGVDCIVTTKAITNVTSWSSTDQDATSGNAFSSNDPKFFSPQITFGTTNTAGGGSVAYDFQFIAANTYNNGTGANIVLQNVSLNTYDIDSNGNNSSNAYQYNDFGGFSSSTLASPTVLTKTYIPATGLTRFKSTTNSNIQTVTDPSTRVQVKYANMSSFSITVGADAGGLAYFFLDFHFRDFSTFVPVSAPSLDLDTDAVGVNYEGSGCGATLNLTKTSQTNLVMASGTVPSELDVTFPTSAIQNGASEKLIINGTTAGTSSFAMNGSTSGTSVTVSNIVYNVAQSLTSGIRKFAFTRASGDAMTISKMEALIDALKYKNEAAAPTGGDRKITLNVLDGTYKSPDAVFTATVTCVSIAGHIWRDANGLFGTSDLNTISANSATGQLPENGAYVVLVNPVTNKVIASQGVADGGGFNFGTVTAGNYILYVSGTLKSAGDDFTAATYPSGGYVSVGENLGAGAGNDLLIDGKLIVTVGSVAITNANFGLNIAPVAIDASTATQPNPGGTQKATVPTLNGTDPEEGTLSGSGNTVQIISLPGNAILYYNGVAVDLANPVITNYNPALLTVDPDNGALTVTFKYQEVDQAGFTSPDATVTMPFTEILISGNVYHDVDGKTNSLIDGTLISSPEGSQLYANLVDPVTGFVVGTYTVTDGAYSFNTFNGLLTSTALHVVISTTQGIVGTTTGTTSVLPTTWVSTADGSGTGDPTPNGDFTVNVGLVDITSGLDFGIEQSPLANHTTVNTQLNPGGTATVDVTEKFSFSDPDGTVSSIKITAFPNDVTSIKIGDDTYTSTNWPAGGVTIVVTAGNLAKTVLIDPADGTPAPVIPFTVTDNAGVPSAPGSVTVPFTAALITISGNFWHDANGDAIKNGTEKPVSGDNADSNSGGSSVTGSPIYANLINSANQVVLSVQVNNLGAFDFSNISPDQSYKVILTGLYNAPGIGLLTGVFPTGWVSTGTNTNGTANVGDNTGVIDLGVVSTNSTGSDFGIELPPTADSKHYSVSVGVFSSTPSTDYPVLSGYLTIATNSSDLPSGALSGSDPEDCAVSGTCSNGKSFEINSLNADTKLYYDFGTGNGGIIEVTAGMTITNYDPSKLVIYGTEGVGSSILSYEFTYSLMDAAGVKSTPVSYSITAAPLPVKLVSFDASKENSSIQLNWSTTEEVNSELFEVEHSADAKTWKAIGSVASYGDTKIMQTYNFTDKLPSDGLNYYRLKMIDRDATFAYSRIRSVDFGNETRIVIYPNPVTDKITIQAKDWTSVTSIEMFNSAGSVVIKTTGENLNNELNINTLPVGMYMLKLGSKNGTSSVHKIVVQK